METFEFETFRRIGPVEVTFLEQAEPRCFNGDLTIRRFKVTVELVDEPVEVLQARLQRLWETSRFNMHQLDPMKAMAEDLGFKLEGQMGTKAKKDG